MNYPIHERFYSFQGEGVHLGRAAFFIRLFGCPIKCDWCDSAGTWHPKYKPKNIIKLTASQLAIEAKATDAEFVVVTGGEPCIHDLSPLIESIHAIANLPVHLETSGAFPTSADFDWVTVSPKAKGELCLEIISKADELKIIMDSPAAHFEWIEKLKAIGIKKWPPHVWLHPEWGNKNDAALAEIIIEAVKSKGVPRFRAGWQVHKMYKADVFDSRSVAPSPLGGVIERGF